MTPAPNPTAEQIVARAMSGGNRAYSTHDVQVGAVVSALRAHGLLSEGAPSIDPASVREAIGEVLADMGALIEDMPVASDLHALTEIADAAVKAATSSPSRTAVPYTTVATAEGEHSQTIRARLLSEGAPSAERWTRSKYISPSLPGMIRNLWKDDPSENSVRTALKLAGDLIQELIDLRAAEGAPSEEQIERAQKQLAAEIHEAWEFQYDECDHGTYRGGHLNGEPYAMCELTAARIVRRRDALEAAARAAQAAAPQAEELPETGNELRDADGDLISSGKHLRVLHQGGYVCDTCTNSLGLNVRWDHAVKRDDHAPVLPSSGVAEDKLAEVKAQAFEEAANGVALMGTGKAVAWLRARAEAYRQERREQ